MGSGLKCQPESQLRVPECSLHGGHGLMGCPGIMTELPTQKASDIAS